MNKWLKELLCIGLIPGLSIVWISAISDLDTIDINVHDTYFVVDRFSVQFLVVSTLLFLTYLFRTITNHFAIKTINVIFIFLTALMTIALTYIFNFLSMITVEGGWTIYPPLSASPNVVPVEEHEYLIKPCYIIFLQVLLLLLLGYTAFRTAKIQTHK